MNLGELSEYHPDIVEGNISKCAIRRISVEVCRVQVNSERGLAQLVTYFPDWMLYNRRHCMLYRSQSNINKLACLTATVLANTTMCLFTESNSMGSPLLLAIRNGEESTAKSILLHGQFSDLEKQGPRKDGSALFLACRKGMCEMAHLLILHGSNINSRTSYGATPLHAAADHNHLEITRLLLGYGADVNAMTKRGDTAVHFAAYRGYAAVVQTLAEAGADVTVENSKSQSPTRLAASRDHHAIAKYLQAVAGLAKYKPKTLDVPKPEPITYHQRTLSDQSLSEEHHEDNCFRSMNIPDSAMDSTQSSAYAYNSLNEDCVEHKEINSVDDKPSLVSVHNICGSQMTQARKDKLYSKNLSWAD